MNPGCCRRGGERGAALTELVVVLPLLILLVVGVIEFGAAWSNKLKVETAARAGARVGSNLGNHRLADYGLLQSVRSVLDDLGLDNVDYVVVYRASDPGGMIPAGCSGPAPTSQPGQCNVYTRADLASLTETMFTGTVTCGADAPDRWWCPLSRENVQHRGSDFLGVWIRAGSPTVTTLFGSPLHLEASAVMRLEPSDG